MRKFSPVLDPNINGFWEYLPKDYDSEGGTHPLLIYLHGAGDMGSTPDDETLDKVKRNGTPKIIDNGTFPESFTVNGESFKFIVISPQIKHGVIGLTSTISPSTIDAVVEYAKSAYRVDPSRIYLTGMSMGGGGTWIYASSDVGSKKLAAIAVAAGAYDLSIAEAANIAKEKIAVLATHNTVDQVVLSSRTALNIEYIDEFAPLVTPLPVAVYWQVAGVKGPYDTDNGEHNVWSRTFEDITPGSTLGGNLTDSLGLNVYEWMLQYQNILEALPVKWVEFEVKGNDRNAFLHWKIGNQTDVKEYIVEKSNNNIDFNAIATVPAHAGTGELEYNYTDGDLSGSITWYRIRQIDADGHFSFSEIRKINSDNTYPFKTSVYPNPFLNQVSVVLSSIPRQTISIQLTDANGKLVRKQQVAQWSNVVSLNNLEQLPKGIYFITISGEQGNLLYKEKLIRK